MHTLIPCLCTNFIGPSGSQDIIPEDGVGREIILYPPSAYFPQKHTTKIVDQNTPSTPNSDDANHETLPRYYSPA